MVRTNSGSHFQEPETVSLAGYDVADVLRETLEYSRSEDYRGWDYCDGMSSRFLQTIPVDYKWLNIAFQETIKRSPVNVRPLFLVEQRRNFMGVSLFALTNLVAHRIESQTEVAIDNVDFEEEARQLVEWLLQNRSIGFEGFCGGHKHRIQNLDGQGEPNDPDVVSTSYAVKALLAASYLDPRFESQARTAADFVVEDLDYREVADGARIKYHLNHPDTYYTINAGAIGARLFVDLYDRFGDTSYRDRARALLDHIAGLQTDRGGWPYRTPSDASHLSMDTHHNAFILESFIRYGTVFDSDRYSRTVERGLAFFKRELVDPSGAPNFDESNAFPRDVHAAANSILLFVYAEDIESAERVLGWTLENLYGGDGQFQYRIGRYLKKRFTLMRWAQAWMAFAISEYLLAKTTGHHHGDLIGRGTHHLSQGE